TTPNQAIKPGIPLKHIHHIPTNIISQKPYPQYFPHPLPHPLPLQQHQYQDVSTTNSNFLEPRILITIQPPIYLPPLPPVRIQDD
ncbi:M24 family metallopeptidase, partial [Staphylococcus aureus]|uniref:M24 family metallopeptidase n=1 Tax=Staphylococcus aureus TaxID=1280 RepID=UPI0011A51292